MLLHLQATQRMWVSSAGPPTTNTLESVCAAGIVPTKKRSSPCLSMNALARAVLSHRNVRMACPIHDVIQQKSRQNSNWRREEIFSSCLNETLERKPFARNLVWTRGSRTSITAIVRSGGARRDRTDDLLLAKQALSQLSYGPEHLALKPKY